jgi:cobalt-zinc-cadmium efflux system membrane fusion protein
LLKQSLIIASLIGSLSFFAGCGSKTEREEEEGSKAQAKSVVAPDGSIHLTPEQVQANKIQTTAVVERELASTISAIGRVTARAGAEAQLFSPFLGRIIADPARIPRIGSVVRRGQAVAEVEQLVTAAEKVQYNASITQLQSAIDQTKQEVALRQIQLNRAHRLYAGGAIALKLVQESEFNLKQAQERLDGAKLQKAQYEAALSVQNTKPRRAPIIAPITGIVTVSELVAGELTDPSKSLLTIVDLSTVWVEAPIHESNLQSVRSARRAEITTPASPGRTYSGSLVTVGNVVDPTNRTVPVTFAVDNPDASLKIGMTAEARVATGPTTKALLVPASAVLFEEGQSVVYVESEPNVFRRRAVTTGERKEDLIVVTSGLNAGEKVVSVGAASLRSENLKGQIPTGEG